VRTGGSFLPFFFFLLLNLFFPSPPSPLTEGRGPYYFFLFFFPSSSLFFSPLPLFPFIGTIGGHRNLCAGVVFSFFFFLPLFPPLFFLLFPFPPLRPTTLRTNSVVSGLSFFFPLPPPPRPFPFYLFFFPLPIKIVSQSPSLLFAPLTFLLLRRRKKFGLFLLPSSPVFFCDRRKDFPSPFFSPPSFHPPEAPSPRLFPLFPEFRKKFPPSPLPPPLFFPGFSPILTETKREEKSPLLPLFFFPPYFLFSP